MNVSRKNGQVRTGFDRKCGNLHELVSSIVELASICAESARAGGGVWYEVTVYVNGAGVQFQVQRHGSVVGGVNPPLSRGYQ